MLSRAGIVGMADLLRGMDVSSISEDSIAFKIAWFIREDMQARGHMDGWQLQYNGGDGQLVLATPKRTDGSYRQYILNFTTDGWGIWTGPEMLCFDTWHGVLYFGTEDGRVCAMDAETDGGTLEGDIGQPIKFRILFNYSNLGAPGTFKRVVLARPDWLGAVQPEYRVLMLYDYVVNKEISLSPIPALTGDRWDVGLWDVARWMSKSQAPGNKLMGTAGQGRTVSPLIYGAASARAILISVDIHWRPGHGL
jgi:hypothetical protein